MDQIPPADQHRLSNHYPHRIVRAQITPSAQPSALGMRGRTLQAWGWLGCLLLRNRFVILIASVVWLVCRSGTQPRRLSYPCQQAATANISAFTFLAIPALARRRTLQRPAASPTTIQWMTAFGALAGLLFIIISAGMAVYRADTADFTPGNPAILAWQPVDASAQDELSPRLLLPAGSEAVVAINRDPSVSYGEEPYGPTEPFDPHNPDTASAYGLIWKTVSDLHLGPADNPLADLIEDVDGDGTIEIMINPNHVNAIPDQGGHRSPVYSHPATIRPLIDMLALAGAQQIRVGDGSDPTGDYFTTRADPMGFTESYFNQLSALWPGVTVSRIDLQNLDQWSWADLGADAGASGASAYFGSGYQSNDLAKAHMTDVSEPYFNAIDPHGRPGPGPDNCIGWQAITDHLFEADVVVDLAKLKVHHYGINTAVLKNWVGVTMTSTYDMGWRNWCRIAHERYQPTDYEKVFGNDIMWREVVDVHRAVLYWNAGAVQTTPQRRYLCILDAINCAERYHVGGPEDPWHHWLHTVLAGVDPVAIDAVGARLQRFDFRKVPIVNNAHADSINSTWPIGTGDPGQVRIVGDTAIDEDFGHQFLFDTRLDPAMSWPDWNGAVVGDLDPPTIHAATARYEAGTWQIAADIGDAHVAYYYFDDDPGSPPRVVRLDKTGTSFTATIDGPAGNGMLVAQDAYFNTSRAEIMITTPVISLSGTAMQQSCSCGQTPPDGTFTVCNIGIDTLNYTIEVIGHPSWLDVSPPSGDSTGPDDHDTVTVSVTPANLMPGTHVATIAVSDPNADNTPQQITLELTVETVSPDFSPGDCDVDLEDFACLQACSAGSSVPPAYPDCHDADLDGDGDVDEVDYAVLHSCMGGPGHIADPDCAD
jgi:hypothetical protein